MVTSTAGQLLRRVVNVDGMSHAALADALCVPRNALDLYLKGNIAIPRLIQVALATLVIEQVPSLVRFGYQLRGQLRATIAYETGASIRHGSRP